MYILTFFFTFFPRKRETKREIAWVVDFLEMIQTNRIRLFVFATLRKLNTYFLSKFRLLFYDHFCSYLIRRAGLSGLAFGRESIFSAILLVVKIIKNYIQGRMIVKGRIFNPRLRADFPRFARKKIHKNRNAKNAKNCCFSPKNRPNFEIFQKSFGI